MSQRCPHRAAGTIVTTATMSSVADANKAIDEGLYADGKKILEDILSKKDGMYRVHDLPPAPEDEALLAEQEKALLRLGQLHRDQKYVLTTTYN